MEPETEIFSEISRVLESVDYEINRYEFKNAIGHRGVLVIRGMRGRLSGWVTNTDPAYDRQGVFGVAKEKFERILQESKPMPEYQKSEEAIESAKLTNEFTQKTIDVLNASSINKKRVTEGKLPANLILSRDAGDHLPKFPSIKDTHGLNFGSFVEMPVEKGIALLTAMQVVAMDDVRGIQWQFHQAPAAGCMEIFAP